MVRDVTAQADALDDQTLLSSSWHDPEGRGPSWTGDSDVDPWAWIERADDEDERVDISGCEVTGVLVALDAARWLPDTLAGLAALRHRPSRLIAIDNDSSDSTWRVLRRACDVGVLDAVYQSNSITGFGDAVRSALRQDEVHRHGARDQSDLAAGEIRSPSAAAAPSSGDRTPTEATRTTGSRTGDRTEASGPAKTGTAETRTDEGATEEARTDEGRAEKTSTAGTRTDESGAEETHTEETHTDETRTAEPVTGQAPQPPTSTWLWLLHDDAIPGPHTLERLLTHVTLDPTIDVTGPKLLLPRRRQQAARISEIGVSISGTGRREVLLDTGEIDQGQRDDPRHRLGVSTCGMLVRRSVWAALDGLDPDLPVFRDGVDFGWRAHLAGFAVVTSPRAEFTHRQVGRAGLRPSGLAGSRPAQLDRYLGLLVVAGHAPASQLPWVWLRLVCSCLLHAVGYLFGKVPGRSLDELLALGAFLTHPGRIHAVRARVAAGRRTPDSRQVVRRLRPRWWAGWRIGAEAISGAVSDRYRSVAGEVEVASIDELTGDDFAAVTDDQRQSPWLSPIVVVGVLSVVASLVAARNLFGIGSLVAPALLPAPSSLGDLWRSVWQPIVGAPTQSSPPWLALAALGSTVLAGRPEWFVTLLLCAVVPLSILAAYPVVRKAVQGRRVRLWVALTYALLPVLLGGTNQGRLSMSVTALVLPLLVLAGRALVLRRPRAPEAWRGGWGAGLALVPLVAFEPSIIMLAGGVGLVGMVALRRSPRKVGRIALALGVPLVVLAPWWPSVVSDWGRLFVGPDSALSGTPAPAEIWQLAIGRTVGPGLPPVWLSAAVFGVIWLVALVGLGRKPRSQTVLAAWISGLLALTMAVLLSRLVVSVPPLGTEVRPAVGVYLLIGFGALVLAGGVGADGLRRALGRRSFTWLQPAVVTAGLLVGLVTVLGSGWWVWAGAAGPISRERLDALPPYVVNALKSDRAVRVLALDLSGGGARYSVVADDQIRLGDADRGYAFGGSSAAPVQAADLVVRLVAGTADSDISPQLTDLGIGFLWVTGASEEQQARIDNTPGLGSASGNDQGTVWQLDPEVSRTVLDTSGTLSPLGNPPVAVPRESTGRLLRLGEAADPRWRATVDGVELTPVAVGWQQAFSVPTAGGILDYSLRSSTHWFLFGQGAAMLVVAVLAAPGIRRPEVRDPTRTARRAATLGGVAP